MRVVVETAFVGGVVLLSLGYALLRVAAFVEAVIEWFMERQHRGR